MNRPENWQETLRLANEDLKNYGTSIQVQEHDGLHNVLIGSDTAASNCRDNELDQAITDAWINARLDAHARQIQQLAKESEESEILSFRKVSGGTHGDPALIASLTTLPVYFHDNDTDEIYNVDADTAGIDRFQDRNGSFYVHTEDYDEAFRQVEEHDAQQ